MAGQEPRSKKLKRLVNVQRQLERMAEGELAANTEQRREVEQSMEVVMEAISSGKPVHMQFSRNYSERYGRLMIKDKQLAGVQQVLESKVLRERTKGDRLEEQMKEARELEDRERDDNAIYELLELTLLTGSGKDHT
ncbi:hypothetical protein ASD54_11400 [Rhizobium sp. Root149]|jgi:mitochondrial fission protein ELM1|uniref:Mitochondrial fission protein ELM1 n=1 Tax=Rhizobium rhizoryzae TaxID=451876 RepID=A0A7W6PS09_9HYPH|nr:MULTISPECIES: hypothetical protein [Rhizobium]KQZ50799.1 hypothetical protein ASD54_11400 [Rhizobium sp. Root149]MBB4143280.1 mitochondrial fission protein ELM1 [Rhizobium rhizoryzae]